MFIRDREKVLQSQGCWGEEGSQVFGMSQRGTIRRFLLSRDAYRDLGVQNSQSQKPGLLYLGLQIAEVTNVCHHTVANNS